MSLEHFNFLVFCVFSEPMTSRLHPNVALLKNEFSFRLFFLVLVSARSLQMSSVYVAMLFWRRHTHNTDTAHRTQARERCVLIDREKRKETNKLTTNDNTAHRHIIGEGTMLERVLKCLIFTELKFVRFFLLCRVVDKSSARAIR